MDVIINLDQPKCRSMKLNMCELGAGPHAFLNGKKISSNLIIFFQQLEQY